MTPLVAAAVREYRRMLAADGRALALDRGSARSYDSNGNLHVDRSVISAATVDGYYGREINASMTGKLGWVPLDEERKYALLRDPEELRRATPTFNRLPVLRKHTPISARKFRPEEVIGATGDNAEFDGELLTNSLVFWTEKAIDLIEDGTRRALSCAYSYDAEMTPGEYKGMPYDGRMTRIRGNHVALVEVGRVEGAVVGDAMPRSFTRPTRPRHFGRDERRTTMPALTARRERGAHDDPPPFSGRPRTGGEMDPVMDTRRRPSRDDEPAEMTAEMVVEVLDALCAGLPEDERDKLDGALRSALDNGMVSGDKRQIRRGAANSAITRLTYDRRPQYRGATRSFGEAFPDADRIKVS